MGSSVSVTNGGLFERSFRQDSRCTKFSKMLNRKKQHPLSQIPRVLVKMRMGGCFTEHELHAFQEDIPLQVKYSPIIARFTKTELRKLNATFLHLAQRSGDPMTITLAEMKEALGAIGINESNRTFFCLYKRDGSGTVLKRIFGLMDKVGNGQVHFKDFAVTCSAMLSKRAEERLKYLFAFHDVDQDGRISKEEMSSALRIMNASGATGSCYWRDFTPIQFSTFVNSLFSKYDGDNSGSLSYEEHFREIFTAFAQKASTAGNSSAVGHDCAFIARRPDGKAVSMDVYKGQHKRRWSLPTHQQINGSRTPDHLGGMQLESKPPIALHRQAWAPLS